MTEKFNEYLIEIKNEPDFIIGSTDNPYPYDQVYGGDPAYRAAAKHGIRVTRGEQKIASVLLWGIGGATGIYENSYLIADDILLICCSDFVYAFRLPELTLYWKKNLDTITCFAIHRFKDGFVVHGELEITKIDLTGHIEWTFSGEDMFLTQTDEDSLRITGDVIEATVWTGTTYRLDANGESLPDK